MSSNILVCTGGETLVSRFLLTFPAKSFRFKAAAPQSLTMVLKFTLHFQNDQIYGHVFLRTVDS